MKDNLIYAYKKIDEDKIVYVGQTINLQNRHYKHFKIDPYDETLREYNYPLSRGIRKYGEDAYELIILEDNLAKEELNDREKYWIAFYNTYYNGYNQSLGGANPVMVTYDELVIDKIIYLLRNTNKSFQEIADITSVSITHISNINTGDRRKRDDISYPIRPSNTKGVRGLKFSSDECVTIHQYIINNPTVSFKDIAKHFKCDAATIRRINQGATKAYRLEKYNYPLRSK